MTAALDRDDDNNDDAPMVRRPPRSPFPGKWIAFGLLALFVLIGLTLARQAIRRS